MRCPYCFSNDSKVLDKRETNEDEVTRRRRECIKCSKRFTTYERVENSSLMVVKKDGRREAFDRIKLRNGLLKACEKRPISVDVVDRMVDEIEAKLRGLDGVEVSSRKIGGIVVRKLKSLDPIAYIRFASVYKEFTDLDSFKEELKVLQRGI